MTSPIESLIIDIQRAVEEIETCIGIVEEYTTDPYQLQHLREAQNELNNIMKASIEISQRRNKMYPRLSRVDAVTIRNVHHLLITATIQLNSIVITDTGMIQMGKFYNICNDLEALSTDLADLIEEVTE